MTRRKPEGEATVDLLYDVTTAPQAVDTEKKSDPEDKPANQKA